jgi:chloramphenicol 3-O phosphotransferase
MAAAAQQELVHAHGCYDLECDTTSSSPLDCAWRIKDFLARPDPPTAFDELRARSADGVMRPR